MRLYPVSTFFDFVTLLCDNGLVPLAHRETYLNAGLDCARDNMPVADSDYFQPKTLHSERLSLMYSCPSVCMTYSSRWDPIMLTRRLSARPSLHL